MEIRKRYVDTTYGQLHLRTAGEVSDCPLVLLHQTASSSIMFERMMAELADDFWLIAPDTPGFGGSFRPKQPPSIELYADAIQQGLEQLDITNYHLFGHHTGASIAVQLAHDSSHLVNKLCLVGPPLISEAQKQLFEQTLIPFEFSEAYVQAIWRRTAKKSADIDLGLLYCEAVLTMQAEDQLHHAYHAVFEQDFAGQIGRINCPTLVLAGENDSLRASLEPTFALLQDGSMRIIPNAGTFICDEQPQLMANLLRTFF